MSSVQKRNNYPRLLQFQLSNKSVDWKLHHFLFKLNALGQCGWKSLTASLSFYFKNR